ncbi:glycosyltransferase family 9 protein [Methylomonas sp. MgM2]
MADAKTKPKSSRFYFRAAVFFYCALFFITNSFQKRKRPERPKRFLIAHHLLLGDTLMLTPMLAYLRNDFPDAVIYFLVSEQYLCLYEKSPYEVRAIGYNPKNARSYFRLRKLIQSVDVAFIPGDNRFSSLAYSLKARWIVAFWDLPKNRLKNLFVDQFVAMPTEPLSWEDMNVRLVRSNAGNAIGKIDYDKNDWPAASFDDYQKPDNYIVLHVGASNPLRYWQPEKWLELANRLEALGYAVVWTAGPQEGGIIEQIDPNKKYKAYTGLHLNQLWDLLEHAKLAICPDTGVSHMAKLTDTPVIVLFGQGSNVLFGKGEFFENHVFYRAVIIDDMPCRNQNTLFKRPIPWVRRCGRTLKDCQNNLCMQAISVDMVFQPVLEFFNAENINA